MDAIVLGLVAGLLLGRWDYHRKPKGTLWRFSVQAAGFIRSVFISTIWLIIITLTLWVLKTQGYFLTMNLPVRILDAVLFGLLFWLCFFFFPYVRYRISQ
ncbi:hypothetical protein QWY20_17230 [Alkalimonas sp. MEB108]|uniref:Uncharacterized protein n=1 Tax=Alkalimonas cellulosilytica TaxID=3058395 RepID=A0ABU7JBE2_9GAMM|nr:hypothetical protein [Alkalimonas sp. MEB108]MEE2003200.1 hypothetical protein [Alkalimonas sp. MEB108]